MSSKENKAETKKPGLKEKRNLSDNSKREAETQSVLEENDFTFRDLKSEMKKMGGLQLTSRDFAKLKQLFVRKKRESKL